MKRFVQSIRGMAVCFAALSIGVALAQTPAFPGAYGFGSLATGGRGGTVVHVTNLNDSGPGSFRDAVSQGNRIVVFDVGGYVVLASPVSVSSNITIAGQTAPGDGIGIMAGEVSLSNKTNIIVRGLRVRQGKQDPLHSKSAINMGDASDIILDHCSVEYGQWDSVDAVKTSNFTVQDSIIAMPIYQQFGAHVERGPSTFYRNLWVDAHNRQPLSKDNTQYINNVIYNYEAAYTSANTGGYFSHDIVNNYFIAGPSTSSPGDAYFQMDNKQSVYAVGNFIDADKDGTLNGTSQNTVGSSLVLTAPWAPTTSTIPTLSAADSVTDVTASAGAFPRDTVDQFAVDNTLSLGTQGTLYKDQAATGLSNDGYGTLNGAAMLPNADGDGIADYWAQANGLSTTDPTVAAAPYGSTGYTNLEVYFNSLVLPDLWSARDLNAPTLNGASSYNPFTQEWVLTGSGMNTVGSFDQAQFASQSWTTNGTLMARIDTLTSGQTGLLVRGDSAANSAFVAFVVDRSGMVSLLSRSTDGGTIDQLPPDGRGHAISPQGEWHGRGNRGVAEGGFGPGVSLRLLRNGNAFAAYISRDGSHWRLFGVADAAMTNDSRAGLAVASGDADKRSVATLSQVAFGTDTGSQVVVQPSATANRPRPTEVTVQVTSTVAGELTGVVQLWNGSDLLGTAGVRDDGTAIVHVEHKLDAGTYSLIATYSGDRTHEAGLSGVTAVTVVPGEHRFAQLDR